MDEYIKKSDMFALLCEDCEDDCESENVYCDYKRFKNIPAADVAPVMHGEWRENGLNGYAYAFICSNQSADISTGIHLTIDSDTAPTAGRRWTEVWANDNRRSNENYAP